MAKPNYSTLATEVVELGENLFELALQGHTEPSADTTASEQEQAYPVEEIRIAANEFFIALRLLLGLPEDKP